MNGRIGEGTETGAFARRENQPFAVGHFSRVAKVSCAVQDVSHVAKVSCAVQGVFARRESLLRCAGRFRMSRKSPASCRTFSRAAKACF